MTRLLVPLLLLLTACGGGADRAPDTGVRVAAADTGIDAAVHVPGPPRRVMAKRFAAYVRTEPRADARRIGYFRAGALTRTKHGDPAGTDGCEGGWYELQGGGFVCNGFDVVVFEGRKLPFGRGRPPRLNEPLPYEYGVVRREAPMYRRLPSDEEAVIHEGYVIPGTEPVPGEEGATPAEGAESGADTAAPAAPAEAPTEPAPAPAAPPAAPAPAAEVAEAEAPPEDTGPLTLQDLQGDRGSVVLRRVVPGFILTIDRVVTIGERRYWRTNSNGFVPAARVGRRRSSTDFHGVELTEGGFHLPVAFQAERGASYYERDPRGRVRTARGRRMGYHDVAQLSGRETIDGVEYATLPDGRLLRVGDVVLLEARPRPDGVGPNDQWIDVDLSSQSLVAYQGDVPVYATLVSTGRRGDGDEDFRTPPGTYRIQTKHVTTTMDGNSASDGPYSIEDVPYVMYFHNAYALHAAFWHDRFGHPKSHGCVNLAPLDARFLFRWSTPQAPEGFHGVLASDATPGAFVIVRGETPE